MSTLQGKRVVVVEDDASIAQAIQADLRRAGCVVEWFADGQAALTHLLERAPDLILLDLKLPSLHGYDLCKQLRRHYSPWSVPIIMVTALDEPIDKLRGFAHGADAYLTKPYDPAELLSTLELTCHALGDIPPLTQ